MERDVVSVLRTLHNLMLAFGGGANVLGPVRQELDLSYIYKVGTFSVKVD